jgi:hypothetical protein
MMSENLKLARLYFLLLALSTVGRITLGVRKVPYASGHYLFSLVMLTIFGCIFYGAFCRRWRGLNLLEVAVLAGTLGLATQIVIFTATVGSYALGVETYFNNPTPLGSTLPVPFAVAVLRRLGGLMANTILASIWGALGWCMGPLLPDKI